MTCDHLPSVHARRTDAFFVWPSCHVLFVFVVIFLHVYVLCQFPASTMCVALFLLKPCTYYFSKRTASLKLLTFNGSKELSPGDRLFFLNSFAVLNGQVLAIKNVFSWAFIHIYIIIWSRFSTLSSTLASRSTTYHPNARVSPRSWWHCPQTRVNQLILLPMFWTHQLIGLLEVNVRLATCFPIP